MPLLLRPSAPSPSIDELAFAVPLSAQSSQRCVSSAATCATHGRQSFRRRRSTAGTEAEFNGCADETCTDAGHHRQLSLSRRASRQSMRHSGTLKPKDASDSGAAFRDSKRSSRETQPDDDHLSSDGSFQSEAGRASSVLSCGCSCADASESAITSSAVVIEDRQLAVVDRELRDLRKTLVRKLYTRFTKISGLARRKSTAKPAF